LRLQNLTAARHTFCFTVLSSEAERANADVAASFRTITTFATILAGVVETGIYMTQQQRHKKESDCLIGII
jgi:hypothetical protein